MSLESRLKKLESIYGAANVCKCGNAGRQVFTFFNAITGKPDWNGQSVDPCKLCGAEPNKIVIKRVVEDRNPVTGEIFEVTV